MMRVTDGSWMFCRSTDSMWPLLISARGMERLVVVDCCGWRWAQAPSEQV